MTNWCAESMVEKISAHVINQVHKIKESFDVKI